MASRAPPALALAATLAAGCAATPRPPPAPRPIAERELTFSLDPDEDPARALAVVSRRLASRGVTRADVTAATGSLTARVREDDAAAAREAVTSTLWLRVLPVDERVDLAALAPSPLPAGVTVESENVPLALGLTMQSAALFAAQDARDALSSIATSARAQGRSLVVVPRANGWRLAAVEPRASLHGAQVARCVTDAPGHVTVVFGDEAAALRRRDALRRAVVEIDGEPRALAAIGTDPVIHFARVEDAAALLSRCADGALRGPIREASR